MLHKILVLAMIAKWAFCVQRQYISECQVLSDNIKRQLWALLGLLGTVNHCRKPDVILGRPGQLRYHQDT